MEATAEVLETSTRDQADDIVRKYAIGSTAPSLIPVPMVDLIAVTAVQLKMLHSLANVYGVEFKKELGRSAIMSLIGGTAALGTARLVSSFIKSVPFVGSLVGFASQPVVSGAATYAIGRVFIQHFESGGTFVTFNPEKARGEFAKQVEEGKTVVSSTKGK